MRICHTADLHLTRGPRLEDQADTLGKMVTEMIAAKADLALIVGDIFGHTVPYLSHPDERNVLFDAVTRLAEHMPVFLVAGNHDEAKDLAGLRFLQTRWSITVCDRPDSYGIVTPSGIVNVHGLPYPSKRFLLAGENAPRTLAEAHLAACEVMGGLLAALAFKLRRARKARPDEPHILAAHIAVCGAQTAGGEVMSGKEIEVSRSALDTLPVDYGALGHIHLRQEVAERAWYSGSPTRTDFSETDPKAWNLVEIGPGAGVPMHADQTVYHADGARQYTLVTPTWNPCRELRTLDYRWAADADSNEPRWVTRPTDAALLACDGAEVRMRLVVSEAWVGGCPWDDEIARVSALAVRVQVGRVVEPILRVRSPEVAAAVSPAEKMIAYWSGLATPPSPAEQESALACLEEVGT